MIVVIGRLRSSAEKRDELIERAAALTAASRAEAGCTGYRFYADTEDPDAFCFVEEWEDLGALKAHFGTPHIASFMQAVPSLLSAAPDLTFHIVERSMGMEEMTAG